MTGTVAAWRAAGESRDAAAAVRCLAADIEVISPLTAAFRFHGREQASDMLTSAFEVITEIRYHTELADDSTVALFYHGRVGRQEFEEAQLLRLDAEGLIRELTFFGRPLPGLTAVMKGIGPRLLRRQGKPGLARVVGLATRPLDAMVRSGETQIMPRANPNRVTER